MPGELFVQVNEGTGKKLRTYERSIGGNTVQESVMLLADPKQPSGIFSTPAVSMATNLSHLLQIMAGASLPVQLRSIEMVQYALATTAEIKGIHLFRLSTAGTGGTNAPPQPHDPADTLACTGMTLPTAKGTEAATALLLPELHAVSALPYGPRSVWKWEQKPGVKPIIIPAGVANGIAFKTVSGGDAAMTIRIRVEVTEGNW